MSRRLPKDVASRTVRRHARKSCRNDIHNHSGRNGSPSWLESHYILAWTGTRAVEPKRQSGFGGRGGGEHHYNAQADKEVRSRDCSHVGDSYTARTQLVPPSTQPIERSVHHLRQRS